MHTLFEGVITYVLGLAIAALIAEKYVTVGELNDRMAKLASSLKVGSALNFMISILLESVE